MKETLRRIVALLMILALSVSFMPAAYAAETDGTIPEDQATSPPETTPPTDAVTDPSATDPTPTEEASAPDSSDSENSDDGIMAASDDGIATVADAEIVGNPTTFATLFLEEAIQIPSFDHLQSKEHVPLYSVYLKNQPGYENNYYIAYCIEPGIVQDSAANYDGNSSTLGALGSDSTVFTYLTPAQLRAMGVALLYGQMEIARKADAENIRLEKLRRWASTQLIIWEVAAGWRSTTPPYEKPSFLLSDFGLESEVFGVLSIPALNLEMPLYLGATYRHMADGAAQMSETSIPIGGQNTNCVIAGHRGWNGAAYFLHIPNLKKGDIVTITNLWETLTYEVVETKIITPTDVEAIHIQPNRDLITLLTCHPPATGGRERYLVFCERITELEVP